MRYFCTILLFLISFVTVSQNSDQQLAQHYYGNEEYGKALPYYEKLYHETPSKFLFGRYVECLTLTGNLKQAEKILKQQASRNKHDIDYQVQLARFYETNSNETKANAIYDELINELRPNASNVIRLFNVFKSQGQMELAYRTLQKGRKLLKNTYPLNYYFAEYYGHIGETEKMIQEYLDLLDYHRSYSEQLKNILSRKIDFSTETEEYTLLKTALIDRTQKHPDESVYADMLTWLFIQRQNFTAAFVQMKALDKRANTGGRNVYNLGKICIENKDYSTAKKCFDFILSLGNMGPYYYAAQRDALNVSFLRVTQERDFSQEEIQTIIQSFETVIDANGKGYATTQLILQLAHIRAFYGQDPETAIQSLQEAITFSGITDISKAELKMELADIHVLNGDIWEAALLYSQIDKDFKYETIGHEAKFKNARIFYYDGEFNYAQSQLDVLKQSTSRLIANDALKLSLLITDNFGLDSNYTAMNWFANADLLIEQHRYEDAFTLLDSITEQFPGHSLGDEILLKKAHAYQIRGQWNSAIASLEELLKYYPQDILADDALFELGNIYENHLTDSEKAKSYYRSILFDYKGSLYTAEVRKRLQALRASGDL